MENSTSSVSQISKIERESAAVKLSTQITKDEFVRRIGKAGWIQFIGTFHLPVATLYDVVDGFPAEGLEVEYNECYIAGRTTIMRKVVSEYSTRHLTISLSGKGTRIYEYRDGYYFVEYPEATSIYRLPDGNV